MNEIVMPKLSDTMTEGRIVSWKKRVGEAVRRGDVLAEVETDKANMELEAFAQGVLLEIRVQAGEMAQVGTVIAVIGKADEKLAPAAPEGEVAPAKPQPEAAPAKPEPEAAPAKPEPEAAPVEPKPETKPVEPKPETKPVEPKPEAEPAEPKAEAVSGAGGPPAQAKVGEPRLEKAMEMGGFQAVEGPAPEEEAAATAGVIPPEAKEAPAVAAPGAAGEAPSAGGAEAGAAPGLQAPESRERAAPVVRRKARELGIDLSKIEGSGPDGRILLQDLERSQAAAGQPAQPTPPPAAEAGAPPSRPAAAEAGEQGPSPMSRLRAAVAKTVSDSWRSIPHFSVTMDIAMDDAESLRRQLKENGFALTVNDVVVKGVALALQGFPRLNASFAEGGIQQHDEINIGIAVGVPEGVLMPVVHGCQQLTMLQISQESRALVERARSGSLSEQEMSGGTFSVSNLGMYGVSQFTAIIYPSQAAVLAVGAVLDSPLVRAGVPTSAKVMKVTLCADHRVADGAYVAEFLVELKKILEHPLRLLV
jgi:pyruvate dehydrogenase E2 component (dihydrolipoamide acetyltransferase)